jgi:hypothetical protein
VTQTAEVEVKIAVMGSFQFPSIVEKGIISSRAPAAMTARKPKQMVRETVIRF